MARRKEHSRAELEQMIVDSAWDIVGQEGGESLSARRIAAAIGYTPGTIYNVFGSMDDVLVRVNQRTLECLYQAISTPKAKQSLKQMGRTYLEFAQTYRPYWLMLFQQNIIGTAERSPEYQEKIIQLFEVLEDFLSPYFTARQSMRKAEAAQILWSSVHGLCYLQETGKMEIVSQKNGTHKMIDGLIDTFIKGLEANLEANKA